VMTPPQSHHHDLFFRAHKMRFSPPHAL
jgi:hypothetical protein